MYIAYIILKLALFFSNSDEGDWMGKFRIIRDIFLIFSLSFTIIMIITLLAGAYHTVNDMKGVFIVAIVYALLALVFFCDPLIDKIGYLPIEIGYVTMLNVTYVIMANIFSWEFTVRGYIINISSSIIMYILVKVIIFSIDKVNADKINSKIRERKKGGGQN